MARGNELYGAAKRDVTRFDLINDPRQGFPVYAVGGLNSSTPPHRLGNAGAAYYYGNTIVGGNRNLFTHGDSVYSIIHTTGSDVRTNGRLILGGGTFWDVALNADYAAIYSAVTESEFAAVATVQGELPVQATTGVVYGAKFETFNKAGGSTVDVTNLSTSVTGNATTFTTDTLVGGYGYTPSLNLIVPGDVIGIGTAGSRNWYRIVAVNAAAGAAALTIFPAYQQGTAAAVDYTVIRTGRGSYSRIVTIPQTATTIYYYYAGNQRKIPGSNGRVQAGNEGAVHYMAPRTVDSAGVPVADFDAQDIIYYKGYLLYGAGTSVGWSVAGFPTAFPFGATDFPASAITVVDNTDSFVAFEQYGDQVVALFRRGLWLVQPTGSVPEFNFYRLPEPIGPMHIAKNDSEIGSAVKAYGRPTTSARNAIYYHSRQGLMQFSGATSRSVSTEVDNVDFVTAFVPYALSWEPTTDSVIWRKAAATGQALCYQQALESWYTVTFTAPSGSVIGLTGGAALNTAQTEIPRGLTFSYYNPENSSLRFEAYNWDAEPVAAPAANTGWIWATPVINMGDRYAGLNFGGFRIDAKGETGTTYTLTWTIYGGKTPTSLTSRQSATAIYTEGTTSAREILGKKLDDPYIAIVLSGTRWIKLTGIVVQVEPGGEGRR